MKLRETLLSRRGHSMLAPQELAEGPRTVPRPREKKGWWCWLLLEERQGWGAADKLDLELL